MNGRDPFRQLAVRPVEPSDADRVRRLFQRLSPESIYRRFFTLFPTPPDTVVRRLTTVDHSDHEALAVLDGDEIVALASWDRPAPAASEAEIALLVEDGWQRKGLGSAMVRTLTGEAARHGITVLNAMVLADNYPARHLAMSVARPDTVVFDGPETRYSFRLAS
ncbi:MAG: GNAT family N-acetyltransferase [Acidimicrobiia bacterium]|nr:GNAT family N-acetyltransferase [Acidimicrobiia bacterium]